MEKTVAEIRNLAKKLTLKEKVGQFFVSGITGTELHSEVGDTIRNKELGGVILFERNMPDENTTRGLVSSIHQEAKKSTFELTPLISVDQEGGLVAPITFAKTISPGNMALAATGNPNYAYQMAKLCAQELSSLGFNLDYAPVLDVNTNPYNPVIGPRAYSDESPVVSNFGGQAVLGFQEGGVAACAKHFPGHGATGLDSHLTLPMVLSSEEQLKETDLKPYRTAIGNGVEVIMTSHCAYPEVIGNLTPASLSPQINELMLRNYMNYNGVIITDALEMKAISEKIGPEKAAIQAFAAGADILLFGEFETYKSAYQAFLQAIDKDMISEKRMEESLIRIMKLKMHRDYIPSSFYENPESLIQNIARDSITIVKNYQNILPLTPETKVGIINSQVKTSGIPTLGEIWRRNNPSTQEIIYNPQESDLNWPMIEQMIKNSEAIIFAYASREMLSKKKSIWINKLYEMNPNLIVVSLSNPFGLVRNLQVKAYVVAYNFREPSLKAIYEVLTGKFPPRGKLPVTLAGIYPNGHGITWG